MLRAKLLLWVLLIPLTIYAAGEFLYIGSGTQGIERNTITLSVVETGDTAKVIRVSQFTARDSFEYIDSIAVVISGDSTDSSESLITWLSPLQVSRISILTIDGRPFAIDTTVTYACTLDAGTNKYGFEWNAPGAIDADTLLSTAIAVFVDSFNNTTGMEDTLLAEDSTSYIKIISKVAMDRLENDTRWTLILGDSLEQGTIDTVTIEMVCDSMVIAINADSIGGYVTAVNLDDTAYTVTSDKKGRIFSIFFADTAQDTIIQVANKKSVSLKADTIDLGITAGFKTLTGRIIIRPGRSSVSGFGLMDSASIWLETFSETGLINVLDSNEVGQIPCTLDILVARSEGDTLLYPYLRVRVYVEDTTTDTTMTVVYPIWFDLTLK